MYKYSEDNYIQDIQDYVDSTYGQHYVNDGIQVIDVWQSRGTLSTQLLIQLSSILCVTVRKMERTVKIC